MKKSVLLGLCLITVGTAIAQKKDLTLEDAVLKRFSHFYPKGPSQLQWIPDSENYASVSDEENASLLSTSASTGKTDTLITLDQLNEELSLDETLKRFPRISWINAEKIQFNAAGNVYQYDFTTQTSSTPFQFPEGAAHITYNKNHTVCAYIFEDNIYVLRANGKPSKVTSDGGKGVVYGQSVHRNEFGITNGLFWSPNGSQLAFYRMDETMVSDYPLVDISTTPATVQNIKYPMAGGKSHHVRLGVYNIKGDPIKYMNTEGDREQYLTSVTWTPKEDALIIGLLNRDQNHLLVNTYSTADGRKLSTLFEEKHEKYVEPEHAAWFVPGSTNEFIWMSERDGYQHLYLYNLDGKLKRQLTRGKWEAHSILGFDETKNYLFVNGTGEIVTSGRFPDHSFNGTQRYTYMVDYELGGHVLVDSTKGTHSATLSSNGKHLMERFTSVSTPLKIQLYQTNGKKGSIIHESENPLAEYSISGPELFSIPGADDQPLYGRIIKPSHFEAGKRYPVLIYVYGGPHAQLVQDRFLGAAPLWMYWFAEQGYVVATIDNRGSANRGLQFEQATFRNLGLEEMSDQKLLVDYLKSQSYIDGERMGVHGWSYGGFMTINMLLTFPRTFKAGVAGGPVCDWSYYEVMYTERYMDTPETNPDGFKNANLVDRAKTLEDDLLVIHGTVDDVVVWQHSQSFVKACVDEGIQLDYFLYPGHPHNVRGKDRYHLMEKVLGYVSDRIGPGVN